MIVLQIILVLVIIIFEQRAGKKKLQKIEDEKCERENYEYAKKQEYMQLMGYDDWQETQKIIWKEQCERKEIREAQDRAFKVAKRREEKSLEKKDN